MTQKRNVRSQSIQDSPWAKFKIKTAEFLKICRKANTSFCEGWIENPLTGDQLYVIKQEASWFKTVILGTDISWYSTQSKNYRWESNVANKK